MKKLLSGVMLFTLAFFFAVCVWQPTETSAAGMTDVKGSSVVISDHNGISKVVNSAHIVNDAGPVQNDGSYCWPFAFSSDATRVSYISFYLCNADNWQVTGIVVDKIDVYQNGSLLLTSATGTMESYSRYGSYFVYNTKLEKKFANNNGENFVDVKFYRNGAEVYSIQNLSISVYDAPTVMQVRGRPGIERKEIPCEVNLLNVAADSNIDVYYTKPDGTVIARMVGYADNSEKEYDSVDKRLSLKVKLEKTADFPGTVDSSNRYYIEHVKVNGKEIAYPVGNGDNIRTIPSIDTNRYEFDDDSCMYYMVGTNLENMAPFTLIIYQEGVLTGEIKDLHPALNRDNYEVEINTDISKYVDHSKSDVTCELYNKDGIPFNNYTFSIKSDSGDSGPDIIAALSSIKFDSSSATLPKGGTKQLKLTGTYANKTTADITGSAAYTSSMPAYATVDKDGLITALAAGKTTITATYLGKSATCTITVTPALTGITVTPDAISLEMGKTMTMKVTAQDEANNKKDVSKLAEYDIEDTGILSITGTKVTAKTAGSTILKVSYGGFDVEVPVTVTKVLTTLTIELDTANMQTGETQNANAIATYSDSTTEDVTALCTWSTSKDAIAAIGQNTGLITAGIRGKASITAMLGKRKAKAAVEVTPVLDSISISEIKPPFYLGKKTKLKVYATYVGETKEYDITKKLAASDWQVDNDDVISIENANVSALAEGTATVTVSYQGKTATRKITCEKKLTKITASLKSITLDAGKDSDAIVITAVYQLGGNEIIPNQAADMTWTSSKPEIATVSHTGVIHAVAKGTTKITITWHGKKVTITVKVV